MKKKLLIVFLALPLLAAGLAYADQGNPVDINVKIDNPFKVGNNLYDLLNSVLDNVVLPIGGILCVLAFIWVGFMYVKAQGKPTEIAKANKALQYAAIGTAILLGAKVIEELLRTTFTSLLS